MPQIIDISGCMPANPSVGMKIKVTGYNLWAVWNGATWLTQVVALKGTVVNVDVTPCLPANPSLSDYYVIYGQEYFYDAVVSKWKCGRPADRQ